MKCAFGVVGKILMSKIKWNLFYKIWIQNMGDIDFEVTFVAENSNKFQKPRFWKEKRGNTWANGTGHSSRV